MGKSLKYLLRPNRIMGEVLQQTKQLFGFLWMVDAVLNKKFIVFVKAIAKVKHVRRRCFKGLDMGEVTLLENMN